MVGLSWWHVGGGRRGGLWDLEEEGEDVEVGADADEADEDGEEEREGVQP